MNLIWNLKQILNKLYTFVPANAHVQFIWDYRSSTAKNRNSFLKHISKWNMKTPLNDYQAAPMPHLWEVSLIGLIAFIYFSKKIEIIIFNILFLTQSGKNEHKTYEHEDHHNRFAKQECWVSIQHFQRRGTNAPYLMQALLLLVPTQSTVMHPFQEKVKLRDLYTKQQSNCSIITTQARFTRDHRRGDARPPSFCQFLWIDWLLIRKG